MSRLSLVTTSSFTAQLYSAARRREIVLSLELLASRLLTRYLFFALGTGFILLMYGYGFGTYDQVIHLPSLKKFADPSLYPTDVFMDSRFEHYSFFWFFFIPFYQHNILEPALFVTHVLATYFTLWGIWTLSENLFHNRLASLLATLVMVFPHMPFGGWTIFEFSTLNRTVVLPFLILALVLYVKYKRGLAFAVLGLGYDLHPLTANFVLAMFLFDSVICWRKVGIKNLAANFGIFLLTALPVLAWKLTGTYGSLTIDRAWFQTVAQGMLSNTYFMFGDYPQVWLFTLSGIGSLAMFWIARRITPRVPHTAMLTNFIIASSIILVVQVVTAYWYPVTILIQAQIIRAGVFALIIGYLYFTYWFALKIQARIRRNGVDSLIMLAALLTPYAFVPVAVWAVQRYIRAPVLKWALALSPVVSVIAMSFTLATSLGVLSPGIRMYAERTPWYDAQIWARDNTPTDAVFITPPFHWSFHESDWRVFSERATVVSITELLEVVFAPRFYDRWRERFEVVAPGTVAQLTGDPLKDRLLVEGAYRGLSDAAITSAACRFGATYLVDEKPDQRAFPIAYENQEYVVYLLDKEHCQ